MAQRRVTAVRKNPNNTIAGLGGTWSPQTRLAFATSEEIISNIKEDRHHYYVEDLGYRTSVQRRDREDGTIYLTTSLDETTGNNLINLPRC